MSADNKLTNVAKEVAITVDDKTRIKGSLSVTEASRGVVLFAHGSGSGRFSPRNQYVAGVLQGAGLATLLIDLLTKEEEAVDLQTRELRFDIELLTARVIAATKWILADGDIGQLPIGYFGASTGAAAALAAAGELGEQIGAVVSRGGRPDLAQDKLSQVKAPTLLIVGGNDFVVIDLNKHAAERLHSQKKLLIVPGATHLFEEPGALEQVAEAAARWFSRYLGD